MGKTSIEYADEVSNPLYARPSGDESIKVGTFCEKPDPEGTCKNCWAEALNKRFGNGFAFDRNFRDEIEWRPRYTEMERLKRLNDRQPISPKFGGPLVVFTNDTYDLFQPSIKEAWRNWIFDCYDRYSNLTLLVQSTYVSRMSSYFRDRYPDGMPDQYFVGMSAGTQKFLDSNIGHLTDIPARRRYVIFEPLLEAIHFEPFTFYNDETGKTLVQMAIVGGESGTKRRPFDVEWARQIKADCGVAGTAFFFKQVDKVREIPADLMIRQFPA